jgi:hypothetical protein
MATPHDQSNMNGQQFADPNGQFARPAGPPPGYFEPKKPKRSTSRTIVFASLGVVLLGIIGTTGYSLQTFDFTDKSAQVDANDNVTKAGGLDVNQLTTGQCFDEPSAGQSEVRAIEAVPCAQPHDAQVIGLSMLTDDQYDAATVKKEAADACEKISAGPTVDQTKLGDNAATIDFAPTAQSWTVNVDRRVTCALDNGIGTKLTGSVLK